jgi:hypothetical protein
MNEEKIDEVEFLKEESLADLIVTIDKVSLMPLGLEPYRDSHVAGFGMLQAMTDIRCDNAVFNVLAIELGKDYFIKFFNFTEKECRSLDLKFLMDYLSIAANNRYDIKHRKLWCTKLVDIRRNPKSNNFEGYL